MLSTGPSYEEAMLLPSGDHETPQTAAMGNKLEDDAGCINRRIGDIRVPDLDGAITAAGGDKSSLLRPVQIVHCGVPMPGIGLDIVTRICIPDLHCTIVTG